MSPLLSAAPNDTSQKADSILCGIARPLSGSGIQGRDVSPDVTEGLASCLAVRRGTA
jgi:hypothetical protein